MAKYFTLFTDGSYVPHKKGIGIGGYLLNPERQEILTFKDQIDYEAHPKEATPHEILALKRGLELAVEQNITHLVCHSDDQSLCFFSNLARHPEKNADKIKTRLKNNPALKDLLGLIQRFSSVKFDYIPREQNRKADKLSKFLTLLELQAKLLEDAKHKKPPKPPKPLINATHSLPFTVENKLFTTIALENNEKEALKRDKIKECSTYLVIHAVRDVHNKDFLEAYEVKKSFLPTTDQAELNSPQKSLAFKLLKKRTVSGSWRQATLELLGTTLLEQPTQELGLMFVGRPLKSIESILVENYEATDKLKDLIQRVENSIQTKNWVLYHPEPYIEQMLISGEYVDHFTPTELYPTYETEVSRTSVYQATTEYKVEERKALFTKEKETALSNITLLHSNYTLGQNPDLEKSLAKKTDKEEDRTLETYRKRSIGKFIELTLTMENQTKSFNERRPHRELGEEAMVQVRHLLAKP